MAKKVAPKKSIQVEKQKPPLIPEKYQDFVFIATIVFLVFAFFAKAIFGNGFLEYDVISSECLKPYAQQVSKEGGFPLWLPYVFSGLPGYASLYATGDRLWDIIPQIVFGFMGFVGKVFRSDVARMACYYALYGSGMYILLRSKKQERFTSFFVAVAAAFSTYCITWVIIGHNTKPIVFAMFPFIIFFLEKLRERFSLIYSVLLLFAIHIMMEAGHLQIIFYGMCAFGLYLLFEFISRLIKKAEPMKVLRSALILLIAVGIAFLMSSDRYLSTLEYSKYSTRGSAPILKTEKQHQDASGGNDYDYATMWSFSPQEMMTFVVPNFYGYGKLKYQSELTNNEPIYLPVYWGPKEFEDSPPYMGILVLGLALLGFVWFRKDVFVQFLMVLSVFSLLLAFGKNFSIIYDFFFYNIPTFSKFRAPSMALVLLHFSIPVLAGYGIAAIIAWRKDLTPNIKKAMWGIIGFSVFFLLAGFFYSAVFKTGYMEGFAASSNGSRLPAQIADFVWNEMITDWYMTAFLTILASVGMYFYVLRKIPKTAFFAILGILLVFDMFRVDWRRMEVAVMPIEKETLRRTDVVDFMQQDKSIYRIADFVSTPPNVPAYFFFENINGYHPAKLRVYQDLMDVANIGSAEGSTSVLYNPFLWNLLNVKYVVANGMIAEGLKPVFTSQDAQRGNDGKPIRTYVFENPTYLQRTYFVKNAVKAPQLDILYHLKKGDFNPIDTAFVEVDLVQKPDTNISEASSRIVGRKNEYINIKTSTKGHNLLVISEIYYPHGWRAYIDGNETTIYKTDYALRSVLVPPGEHQVELRFTSREFEIGKTLSLWANVLSIVALAGGIFFEVRRRKSIRISKIKVDENSEK
ncbi:MAG: YfhO family protein [Bacteroidota bacterium]